MELAFASRSLRSMCEEEGQAAESLGSVVAADLHARLADLRAADTIAALGAGTPDVSSGDNAILRLIVGATHEIICRVNHASPPRLHDGSLDWQRVRRLRVEHVGPVLRADHADK